MVRNHLDAAHDLNVGFFFVSRICCRCLRRGASGVNNKYACLALRSSAQISYELPLALAWSAIIWRTHSASRDGELSERYWLASSRAECFPEILGFIVFLIASFAETNRIPFDLPEAENELVAGFHTEYSSMSFAAFFMAEYATWLP